MIALASAGRYVKSCSSLMAVVGASRAFKIVCRTNSPLASGYIERRPFRCSRPISLEVALLYGLNIAASWCVLLSKSE